MPKEGRNHGKHTSEAEVRLNIINALKDTDYGVLTLMGAIGYMAYPNYFFKNPQGAALAVGRIMRKMQNEGVVAWNHIKDPFPRDGYYLTNKGKQLQQGVNNE